MNNDNDNNNDKTSFFGYRPNLITFEELCIKGFNGYTGHHNIKYGISNLSYEELLNTLSSNNSILSKSSHIYKNFTIKDDNFFKYINNVKSNFNECNFNDLKARISNCNFLDSVFDNCILFDKIDNCNFENSNFIFSNVFSSIITKCNFTNCVFNQCLFYHRTYFDYCNLTNSKFYSNIKQLDVYDNYLLFYKCCMENMDMSNNNLSNCTVRIKECNTKNAKFNGCVVKKLDSNFTFHVEFLLKGGIVENTKDNYVNKVLTWIGQKIN